MQVDDNGNMNYVMRFKDSSGAFKYKTFKEWQAVLDYAALSNMPLEDDGSIPLCDGQPADI